MLWDLQLCEAMVVQDTEDDIRAVAADALLPASAAVVAGQSSVLAQLKAILWDTLLTLEDLSLSTGHFLRQLPTAVLNLQPHISFSSLMYRKGKPSARSLIPGLACHQMSPPPGRCCHLSK